MDKNVKQYIQLEIYLEEMCVILKDNLSFETEEAFLTGVASEEITSQQFY